MQPSTSSAFADVLFILDLYPKWQSHNWKIPHSVAHTKSANMWSSEQFHTEISEEPAVWKQQLELELELEKDTRIP